jgi:L-serine dehydratase
MTSIFDLFKIGIGPSSSHTVGPMRAAKRFVEDLSSEGLLSETDAITIDLYGSLALTGIGHGTDRTILLGLMGELPDEVDPAMIEAKLVEIRETKFLRVLGKQPILFDLQHDLVFRRNEVLPGHSNGLRFVAYNWLKQTLALRVFYFIGGGFILAEGEQAAEASHPPREVPYPFKSAANLLRFGSEQAKPI